MQKCDLFLNMYIHVYVIISHAALPLQTKVVAIIYACDEQCTQIYCGTWDGLVFFQLFAIFKNALFLDSFSIQYSNFYS